MMTMNDNRPQPLPHLPLLCSLVHSAQHVAHLIPCLSPQIIQPALSMPLSMRPHDFPTKYQHIAKVLHFYDAPPQLIMYASTPNSWMTSKSACSRSRPHPFACCPTLTLRTFELRQRSPAHMSNAHRCCACPCHPWHAAWSFSVSRCKPMLKGLIIIQILLYYSFLSLVFLFSRLT